MTAKRTGFRRVLRWLRNVVLGVALLLTLVVLTQSLWLPTAVSRLAAKQGLDVQYEDLDLWVLGGALSLTDVQVRPKPEEEPAEGSPPLPLLLHLDYLHLDADISSMLLGDLRVHRVEVDGADAWVQRDAQGAWNLDPLLARWSSESGEPDETEEVEDPNTDEEPAPWDLRSPVRVDAIRLQGVRLHFADALANPPLDTRLDVHVSLTDVGVPDQPARLIASADAPELLDGLRLNGTVDTSEHTLDADLGLRAFGLHLGRVAHLLEDAGIRPVVGQHGFAFDLAAELAVPAEDRQSLTGELRLREVALTADLAPAFQLGELRIPVQRFAPDALHLGDTLLNGLVTGAHRTADGTLRIAGLDLIGSPPDAGNMDPNGPAEEEAAAAPAETAPAEDLAQASDEDPPMEIRLGQFLLEESTLRWRDDTVQPSVDLALGLAGSVANLAVAGSAEATGGLPDPAVALELQLPGVWEQLTFRGSGKTVATEGRSGKSFTFELDAQGLTPVALDPYLHAAGLEQELEGAALAAQVEVEILDIASEPGSQAIRASVQDLQLGGEQAPTRIASLALDLTQSEDGTHVHNLEWAGTQIDVRRDADGAVHVAGLILGAREAQASGTAAAAAPSGPGETPPPTAAGGPPTAAEGPPTAAEGPSQPAPRLRIDQARWSDTRLRYIDESTPEPIDLVLGDLGLELTGLDLFGDPARPTPEAAQLRTWFGAEGLATELSLEGTLQTAPGPLDLRVDMALVGRGLRADAIAPLLEQAGLRSELDGASLDLKLDAHVRQLEADLAVDAALSGLNLENRGEVLVATQSLTLEGLRSGPDGVALERLALLGPQVRLLRDADGGMHVAGIHIPPPPPAEEGAEQPDDEGESSAAAPAPAQTPVPAGTAETDAPPTRFRANQVELVDLEVSWADDAVQPEVDTLLTGSMALTAIDTLPGAEPARVAATLGLERAFDELRLEGALQADPKDLFLSLDTGLDALSADSIAAYMPAGLEFLSGTTQFRGAIDASYTALEGGARSAELELRDVALSGGPDVDADFVVERLRFAAPLLDDVERRYELDGVELTGMELQLVRTGPTRFELAGLAFEAPPEPESSDSASASTPETVATDGDPLEDATAAGEVEGTDAAEIALEDPADVAAAGPVETPASQPADGPVVAIAPPVVVPPPTVITGPLAIGPLRLRYTDATQPEAPPLVASVRLVSSGTQTLVAPEPEDLPPLEWQLEGTIDPLLESLVLEATIAPWATDPALIADLTIRGLRGERLADVAPDVAAKVRLDDLPNGSFDAHLETVLTVRRRGVMDMGLDRDFGLSFQLRDVALRPTPDSDPLLSCESFEVEAERIALATGDMKFSRVEVLRPMVHAVQDVDGLHVAGLLFPPGDPDAEAPPTVAEENESETGDSPPGDEPPAGVVQVENFLVSGLQTSYTDETTEPRTYLPIADMELEVRGLSTAALVEPRPIRVQGFLDAGLVDLPERSSSGSLLTGVLGAASNLVVGGGDYESEERRLWDQLEFSSRLTLAPSPKGWVRTNLLGLELPAFRGLANTSGLDIGDGLMDTQMTMRFYGEEGLGLQTKTQFDYLSLSEPANGPISRYLALPAPLDTVLFLLRNDQGQQSIPLSVRMGEDGLSTGQVAGAAANALVQLIGEAVAASPLRIGGTLTDLIGLSGEPTPVSTETSYVGFAAGAITPEGGLVEALEPVLARMRAERNLELVVQHELGPGDLAIADRLANPGTEALTDLLERLRSRKASLLRRRSTQAAQVQALYQVGEQVLADAASAELRRLDRELGETEGGLEELLQRLRPGADRRASRRARNASQAIGQERLDRVKAALLRSGVRDIFDRIDVRRPRVSDVQAAAEGEDPLPQDLGGRISFTPRPRK